MQVYEPALLKELRAVTREMDTFLICDEVFTGFGRSGPMWGVNHADIAPDILCTAKGLSGGMLPFAATLATERVFEGFRGDKRRALMHGHTFYGNPLGAAVAREVLAIYREEDVIGKAIPKAEKIRSTFAEFKNLPGVTAVRSIGMMGAVDVGDAGYFQTAGRQVCERALKLGALLRPLGNTVYVTPPINIAGTDLDSLLSILGDALEQTLRA